MITTPENSKTLSKDISPIDTSDGDDKGTKGLPCDIRVEDQWEFHHYETVINKRMIIWPEPGANLTNYRTYWGFNSIIIGANIDIYNYVKNTCGYETSNIIVSLTWSKTVNQIKSEITNIYSEIYYLDEPLDQYRFYNSEILAIANHMKSLYPN